jgi:hypothetical protein
MRRWLLLSEYHWAVLLILLAVCATLVAWISFGLINVAMSNAEFLARYGFLALREGGLLQLLEIGAKAAVALGGYLGFKAIETELIHRWREAGK